MLHLTSNYREVTVAFWVGTFGSEKLAFFPVVEHWWVVPGEDFPGSAVVIVGTVTAYRLYLSEFFLYSFWLAFFAIPSPRCFKLHQELFCGWPTSIPVLLS